LFWKSCSRSFRGRRRRYQCQTTRTITHRGTVRSFILIVISTYNKQKLWITLFKSGFHKAKGSLQSTTKKSFPKFNLSFFKRAVSYRECATNFLFLMNYLRQMIFPRTDKYWNC
jgi:hypothetical protein